MNESLLDNPIWNALRTEQAGFAQGNDRARRYSPDIGPLAGIHDHSEVSYDSLRSLAGDYPLVLFSLDPIRIPHGWNQVRDGKIVQMVRAGNGATATTPIKPDHKPFSIPGESATQLASGLSTPVTPNHKPFSIPGESATRLASSLSTPITPNHKPFSIPVESAPAPALAPAISSSAYAAANHKPFAIPGELRKLTATDAPAMVALAELTEPGPFRLRTLALGNFYGIFHGDQLVSMAGKRMHVPGYIEVSGVCTHPDARGRGYARRLMKIVMDEIEQAGCKPFLHAWADNPAITLYESLGFSLRHQFHLAALKHAN